MAKKLIMNKGLPRTGKSTWATEYAEKSGNAIIISRDDIRAMLHKGKWTPRNEKITMAAQKALAISILNENMTVIIDDTNLSQGHEQRWKQVAQEAGATFEVREHEFPGLHELIRRDMLSNTRRGANVITDMAMKYGYVDFPDDSVVLCDLDGTLCDIEHRRHFVKGVCAYCGGDSRDGKPCITTAKEKADGIVATHVRRDWDSFFKLTPDDDLREEVAEKVRAFAKEGKTIIFVSARPERCRKDTEEWLVKKGFVPHYTMDNMTATDVPYFALLMRKDGDSRDDTITKAEILNNFLKKRWVHLVIDDRPKVIEMWRSNGITVIDVGDGIPF